MKNKVNSIKDYLLKIPVHKQSINWTTDTSGAVTLEKQNTGIFNRIAQKLLKKPKISYIHLDKMGNFVWPLIDGKKDITDIGVLVKEHFGEEAEPLYERLTQYFKILESYGFIEFKN